MKSSEHDHGHYTREKEHNHEGVHYGKVVDLIIWVAFEINIPAVGPP